MSVTLYAENYRVLRKVRWTLPQGVCALVGPNGSGKTTLLDLPSVLREILLEGGINRVLGLGPRAEGLRNLHAKPTDPVVLGIDLDAIQWRINFFHDEKNRSETYSEQIRDKGKTEVDRRKGTAYTFDSQKSNIDDPFRIFADARYGGANRSTPVYARPVATLAEYRLYRGYQLDNVRNGSLSSPADRGLNPSGTNVFTVLRNWLTRRETKPQYDFVIESLKEAFPDVADDLDLEPSASGHEVTGRIGVPGTGRTVPISLAPNGWLTGLLHLTAVASTPRGGIVAIDEPENGLHPFATKQLVRAMREWADAESLTILLATHSLVLLDEFKSEPSSIFVMEPGRDVLPVPLDEVRDPEWLSQFSLGDLYKYGEFGAPVEEQPPAGV